ncbi:unnamed protein product [Ectocarpus sp. 4 AP-2014]
MDPSTCTFWCAIARGVLAKGSPIESVRKCRRFSPSAYVGETPGRLTRVQSVGIFPVWHRVIVETPIGGWCFFGLPPQLRLL